MFTGLIVELGKIKKKTRDTLAISSEVILKDLALGDSVAVNGVCVTVCRKVKNIFEVNLLRETFSKTNLGKLRIGDSVNIEPSLKVGSKLGGHFVTGHIDCTGKLIKKYRKENDYIFEIEIPVIYKKFIVPKGSIAIDGVSLTVVKVFSNRFTVHIIPFTLKYTTLSRKNTGSVFNIEVDILSKYTNNKNS